MGVAKRKTRNRHDLLIAIPGDRVRVAETEVDEETGKIAGRAGETDIQSAREMLSTLPTNHNIDVVTVLPGKGHDCGAFLTFAQNQAKVKDFGLTMAFRPRPAQQIFDGFYEVFEDVTTEGNC
jgi:hypothetical protein